MNRYKAPDPGFRHAPPRKHVLLLSCMDQRLLDDTVSFMNGYNLANRYDQVIFAGTALGVMHLESPPANSAWNDVFFHHLQVAIDVLGRKIKDIFILEHRDCGAYKHFHPSHNDYYGDDPCGQNLERDHHCEQAFMLANKIREYCLEQQGQAKKAMADATCEVYRLKAEERLKAWKDIHVKCFLMDLEGKVEHLSEAHWKP